MDVIVNDTHRQTALNALAEIMDSRLDAYGEVVDVYLEYLPTTPVTLYLLHQQFGTVQLESMEWVMRFMSYYSFRERIAIPSGFVLTDYQYALFEGYASTRVGV